VKLKNGLAAIVVIVVTVGGMAPYKMNDGHGARTSSDIAA
jgi:hypothetical protein